MDRLILIPLFVVVVFGGNPNSNKFIDLTHAFNNETVAWPGRKSTFNTEIEGETPNGIWIASKGFCTSEHTATHIDAPYHVYKNGRKLNEIPLDDLIDRPGIVIDIYDKVHRIVNGELNFFENYILTKKDVIEWEEKNGAIPERASVLLRTGWDQRWPNVTAYRGEKSPSATSVEAGAEATVQLNVKMNFPGFGANAAKYLAAERNVLGVGIDCLSIDPGNSKIFPAHKIFGARNIWMLEMVAGMDLLPPRGFNLWVVPFKIDQGTGAPTRVLARINN